MPSIMYQARLLTDPQQRAGYAKALLAYRALMRQEGGNPRVRSIGIGLRGGVYRITMFVSPGAEDRFPDEILGVPVGRIGVGMPRLLI
jgi:hypothetical protein